MNIPNLTLDHDRVLDPMLRKVLEKLSLDKPNWRFTEPKNKHDRHGGRRSMEGKDAPEGSTYCHMIVVMEDDREAGRISVYHKYRRRGAEPGYELRSKRIENGRRGNRMETIKLDVAVRNAKKFFESASIGETLFEAEDGARDELRRTIFGLQVYVINGHAFSRANQSVSQFMYATLTGRPILPTLHDEMKRLFVSKEFEEHLAKFELGEHMKRKNYTAMLEEDGGFYFWEDDANRPSDVASARKANALHLTFDDLPEYMQNKIAVLRLVENHELVLDVGFRVGDNMFLVAHD